MQIAQIIDEIDAYLLILRQARDLLLASKTGASHLKRPVRGEKKVVASTKPKLPTLSGKPRNHPSQSRSGRQRPKAQKRDGRAHSIAAVPGPVAQQPVRPEQALSVATARIPAHDVNKDGQLPKTPIVLKARTRRMGTRGAISRKPNAAIKPAIALAGSVHSKVVVVSAEQLQRQREQAATPPPVQRPRIPASGLSGRRAFEALFKSEGDPSNSSGD
jgi:hypothetical protein